MAVTGGPTLGGAVSVKTGVGIFSRLAIKTAGNITLTAKLQLGSIPTTLMGTSDPFNVLAAGPARITYTSGGSATARQSATVGQAFANNLVATVTDRYGNVVPNATVTFKIVQTNGAGATFASTGTTTATANTDGNGQASIALNANTRSGSYIVKATVARVSTAATFALTNVAGAATQFVMSAPARVYQGSNFLLTVKAVDQYGNVDTKWAGTLHFNSSDTDSRVHLPPDLSITNGAHTFGAILETLDQQNIEVSSFDNPLPEGGVSIDVVPPPPPPGSVQGRQG
jgi:hypothetical protein